jgi:nucleoporin NDC1
VTDVCLAEIRDLVHRINRAGDPYYNSEDADKKQMPPAKAQLVGQIAQPLKKDPIAAPYQHADTRLGQIEDATSRIARTHSSPNNPQYAWASEALKMSQATANQAAREAETYLTSNKAKLARSPLGWPFRISLARTAKIVINGAPTSRYYLILNAIATLTNLTVLSLKEDAYGQFQKEVPDIIRAFTAAIGKVEAYVAGLKPHWTDVDMLSRPEAEWRKIVEVEEVQARLREGLERMLRAFGEYLVSLDMSKVEIAEAKRCVARGSEVAEVR